MNKAELDTRVKKLVEEAPEVENIHFDMGSAAVVCIKDQSVLPAKDSVIFAYSPQAIFDAIKMLKVRGAPAIGICAAFGIARAAVRVCNLEPYCLGKHVPQTEDVITYLDEVCAYLAASRPTAVNLFWAINRMRRVMYAAAELPVPEADIVPVKTLNPEEPVYNPEGFEALLAALYAPEDDSSAADGALEDASGGAADGAPDGSADGMPDGAAVETSERPADAPTNEAAEGILVEPSAAHSTETRAFDIAYALVEEALRIQREDIEVCAAIAQSGLELLKDGQTVITHCNAGPLATSKYGTALGPLLLAKERGMNIKAFADETRPLLQGARLTTYELMEAGVDVTLICDNMSSYVMREGLVDAVMVGCDRVAANGDTANKIGTSMLALAAKHYGIPFYVMCPTSTIDLSCESGDDITIELRDPEEISTKFYPEGTTPTGVQCLNPAFDVTEADLITAIVTERGCVYPPFTTGIRALFEE